MLVHEELTLVEALSKAVESRVKYVSWITTLEGEFFICLGEHEMFLLNSKFDLVLEGLPYSSILEVLQDTANNMIQLLLKVQKNSPFPERLSLKSQDPASLLEYMECGWCTDYMYSCGLFAPFPLKKGNGIIPKAPPSHFRPRSSTHMDFRPSIPFNSIRPPQGKHILTYKGHAFQIPTNMRSELGKEGSYITGKNNTVRFQIEVIYIYIYI